MPTLRWIKMLEIRLLKLQMGVSCQLIYHLSLLPLEVTNI
ncbi:CS3 fimbrial subunit A [Escherichia coli 2730350]|nr:CS3 fimbrial subunit A [Escherichia coli 2730350]